MRHLPEVCGEKFHSGKSCYQQNRIRAHKRKKGEAGKWRGRRRRKEGHGWKGFERKERNSKEGNFLEVLCRGREQERVSMQWKENGKAKRS